MTTIEDEKGYEIAKQYLTKKYGDDYVDFLETEGQSYLDGYEQGYEDCRRYAHDYYKPKWHDLQKDPNDWPEKKGEYWTKYDNASEERGYFYDVHYFEPDKPFYKKYWSEIGVIAWYELPKLEEE